MKSLNRVERSCQRNRVAPIEPLEPRLLMAFSAHVNFQPTGAATPAGYVADVGAKYGTRPNGMVYGWNDTNSNASDRDADNAPDQRYDTFNLLKSSGAGSAWEIKVPNGAYDVTVVAGDPTATSGTYKIKVESLLTVDGSASASTPWVQGTRRVTVTDGKLTVRSASGAVDNRIDFIDIVGVPPTLTGLTLINAGTDRPLGALAADVPADQQVIDLFTAGLELNVRADAGAGVGSVKFVLDGKAVRTESGAPYSIGGDAGGDYAPWTPAPGAHVLTAIPYSAASAGGVAGAAITVNFTVVDSAPLDAKVARAIAFAQRQLKQTLTDLGGATTKYARATNADGTWAQQSSTNWASGFVPGSLWQMYALTNDASWRTLATASTKGLKGNASQTEDLEFRVFIPFSKLLEQAGDATARQVLLAAAASKSAQFNDKVGAFRASGRASKSGDPRANFGVLMDQTMDLELMFWAARETGNQTYYDQAVRHAQTVAANHVRANGGSYQWVYYDSNTGQRISGETSQGYSNASTWSRGQAWGVYAFTMIYRETGDAQFLATAKKMADYFIAHLPADNVPFWDFNDPAAPNTFKDSSAAAIAASGLLELGRLAPDAADAVRYNDAGKRILGALASPPYLAAGTASHGILNRAAPNVKMSETDRATSWGDYYFLEAIQRFLDPAYSPPVSNP